MTAEIDEWSGWPRCGYCKSLVNRDSMRCLDDACPGRYHEWDAGSVSLPFRKGKRGEHQ